MANQKPLISVFGATGAQGSRLLEISLPFGAPSSDICSLGGSVVAYLLNSNKYRVRGLTRNPNEQKAKDLTARGVEMVQADIANDSVDKLASALKGSYGAFLLTNFWDPSSMHKGELITSCVIHLHPS
jgi:hypothetical protein